MAPELGLEVIAEGARGYPVKGKIDGHLVVRSILNAIAVNTPLPPSRGEC
jgi:hypothetical protein